VRRDSAHAQAEFERRKAVRIGDFERYVASKEDVIISKLSWARESRSELQLRDVKRLLATDYDQNYVLDWTKKLGPGELLPECLRGWPAARYFARSTWALSVHGDAVDAGREVYPGRVNVWRGAR